MNLLAKLLTFLLFIGPVVLAVMGWPLYGFVEKSKVLYLYPSFYILTIFVFVSFLQGKLKDKKYKYALWIVIITFLWYFIDKTLGREGNMNVLFHSMALPAMYYIFYGLLSEQDVERIRIRNLILYLFTFNGLMAIFERITLSVYYPYDLIRLNFGYDLIQDEMVFRSAALLGHPLTNALCMSIVMIYILISDIELIKKSILYFIGFFSLFCFNARAAIMISAGTFALYTIRPLFRKDTPWTKRFFSLLLLVVFVFVGIYLLNAGFGGRFEEQGDFSEDGSALARIEVFSIFNQYGIANFLWGMPYKDVENMALAVLGMTHIENWFILSTMIVGLVITTIVVILFIPVYCNAIKPYD